MKRTRLLGAVRARNKEMQLDEGFNISTSISTMLHRLVQLVAGCLIIATVANANVIISTDTTASGGSFSFTDDNIRTFTPPFVGSFETLLADSSFSSVGPMVHTVQVPTAADLHFDLIDETGIRWVETVTNNTGVDWTDFHISLGAPVVFRPGHLSIPEFVDGSDLSTNVAGLVNPNGWTVTANLPPGTRDITFDFTANPLSGAGGAFSYYMAIQGTEANVIGQDFTVTQTPSVPIPAAVWLFGSGLMGLVGIARRKAY
jgi:hypothetical protein